MIYQDAFHKEEKILLKLQDEILKQYRFSYQYFIHFIFNQVYKDLLTNKKYQVKCVDDLVNSRKGKLELVSLNLDINSYSDLKSFFNEYTGKIKKTEHHESYEIYLDKYYDIICSYIKDYLLEPTLQIFNHNYKSKLKYIFKLNNLEYKDDIKYILKSLMNNDYIKNQINEVSVTILEEIQSIPIPKWKAEYCL